MYIIKQVPEDFVVEEIAERDFNHEKGKYSIYLMRKRNYNTEDAIQEICRKLNIQRKNIGYAGAKDRNAVTSQCISVLGKAKELHMNDVFLEHLGYSDEPISLGSLKGNKFIITVRNLDKEEEERIMEKKGLDKFINYFDSQRFSKNNAELGKLILKRKYKEACELIILEESRISDELKRFLVDNKNAYLNALKMIPRKTLMIYVHAYQSLLWNKAAKEAILQEIDLEKIRILGFGTELEGEINEIYEKILSEEEITLRDFILRDFPEISLEGEHRDGYARVFDFKCGDFENDELNKDRKKVQIQFFLQKGAYATMAVKHLLGEL